ncbi:hypothetical protein, partial [Salinivibrio sp. VYel6]
MHSESISKGRYSNSSKFSLRLAVHYFFFTCPLLAILLATPVYDKLKRERYLSIFLGFIFVSFYGSKAPIITFFLVYIIGRFISKNKQRLYKHVIAAVVACALTLLGVYVLFNLQYDKGELSLFYKYFINRVFVAQM